MKPYNERLPLIDEAVECHKGVWPFGEDVATTEKFNCGMMFKVPTFTRHEFEQRAKELGWINGYKWGVEYETNGEKPNLPDDVEVEWASHAQWVRVDKVCNLEWGKSDPYCVPITKFRIVDERYKPKEQEMNNDWYEKGELPPVGTVCDAKIYPYALDKFEQAKVVYHSSKNVVVVEYKSGDIGFLTAPADFRPLRTETDKLIEQAMSLFSKSEATTDAKAGIEHAVTVLIEEGYRKIKPMSEQEFMERCVDICGHGSTQLYRAGCRFIDQGE